MTAWDLVDEGYRAALRDDDPVALYDRAPCGYLSTTPNGLVTKINATLLRWLGYADDELIGRPFTDLLTRGGRLYHETHLSPMLHGEGSVQELALDLLHSDGSRVPVLINAALEREPDGRPLAIRVAVFNATERRRYERELLAAKEAAEAERERSRRLSATLQSSIRPPAAPTVPGLTVAAAYHPAGDGSVVGGDFYDCFQLPGGDWLAVLGDVSGKGPEAAIVTTLVRYSLRGLAAVLDSPGELLTHLNRILLEHPGDRFCTVVVLRLGRRGEEWRVTLASGGHPPALLLSGAGAVREVRASGPLVGAVRSASYTEVELPLLPDEALLLYTDGVTEARSCAGFYGDGRLKAACSRYRNDPAALVDDLLADVLDHQGGVARDDIAILALGGPQRDR